MVGVAPPAFLYYTGNSLTTQAFLQFVEFYYFLDFLVSILTPAQSSSRVTAEQKSSSPWPRAMLAPKS